MMIDVVYIDASLLKVVLYAHRYLQRWELVHIKQISECTKGFIAVPSDFCFVKPILQGRSGTFVSLNYC